MRLRCPPDFIPIFLPILWAHRYRGYHTYEVHTPIFYLFPVPVIRCSLLPTAYSLLPTAYSH
ncbi:hypothetical protein [Moorena sp. SIO3I6]|uniref:hypothetical protein n=1 Tax=Moorena sp. SIO3I6 TaxID=2607831 RepID=UPI0013F9F32F|nr:hypothetical protein [Moorena sp. SIO3I6]NEP20885.1 hypothetical protein [Moorena sp. SIO3I6]